MGPEILRFLGDVQMKKWKIAILALVIALFFAWYVFRPERLVFNHSVHEELPTTAGGSSAQTLAYGTFHSVLYPTGGPRLYTVLEMVVAFFASPTSGHRTALTFTSTWWLLRTQKTTPVCSVLASSIRGRSRETSVTKTTLSDPTWTCQFWNCVINV